MSEVVVSVSGTRTGREISNANLAPRIKPGDVLNPTGRNQYTAAKERFAEAMQAHAAGDAPGYDGKCRAEVLAELTLDAALNSSPLELKEVLKRLWPEIQQHEVAGPGGTPLAASQTDLSHMTPEELAEGRRIAAKMLMGRPQTEDVQVESEASEDE